MTLSTSTLLPTENGDFKVGYHKFGNRCCVSCSMGDVSEKGVLVRLQSSCLFSESFHAIDCDCNLQLSKSLELIAKEKRGVIVYSYQEGRGQGLENKIRALELERLKEIDTVDAFKELDLVLDPRQYKYPIMALKELNVSRDIMLISNNPRKKEQLEKNGFNIMQRVELVYPVTDLIKKYLKVVKNKLGHKISDKLLK